MSFAALQRSPQKALTSQQPIIIRMNIDILSCTPNLASIQTLSTCLTKCTQKCQVQPQTTSVSFQNPPRQGTVSKHLPLSTLTSYSLISPIQQAAVLISSPRRFIIYPSAASLGSLENYQSPCHMRLVSLLTHN